MPKKLDTARRNELLDKLMRLIEVRGFSQVSTSEMATTIGCSVATLYKLAPSKEEIVGLAIRRWGERTFARLEDVANEKLAAADRARAYYQAGAKSTHEFSNEFRRDVERFESPRLAWKWVSDSFVDRFVELLDTAVASGEIRPVNTRFLSHVYRQIAVSVRDERALRESRITSEEALLLVDSMIWDGIRQR